MSPRNLKLDWDTARRFFDNWRSSLKWQRLGPYERFADMIDRHRGGIADLLQQENKVSLGFVEASTKKFASSSDAPTSCGTKNIFASRSPHVCFRRYDPQNHSFDSLNTRSAPFNVSSAHNTSLEQIRWIGIALKETGSRSKER
jgi:hypothetical protein